MDAGIGLGLDIDQSLVRGVEGNDGVLSPFVAEQDKGASQTLGLSVIIYLGSEVTAFIFVEDELIAVDGVSENKILELLKGWVFKRDSLVS